MANLSETPTANRVHIAFFGLRNAGKSTLVNAFTGQALAIVSDTPGTTTDPVTKAMEILPLGPCLITDTAGLDDDGELGRQRVEKTLQVLETTDIAVWVTEAKGKVKSKSEEEWKRRLLDVCRRHGVVVLEYCRGEDVEELKQKIAAVKFEEKEPGLLDGLVAEGDRVLCVCPIDESAPKGRLILPQVQVLRACLDLHATCTVCQPEELARWLLVGWFELVITDSQAFRAVKEALAASGKTIPLISFSILFARQKGDLAEYVKGLKAIKGLQDGDKVLVSEGCTHHRQCNDIGTVKIPKALEKLSGCKLKFEFASGASFAIEQSNNRTIKQFSLVVQCGGCMLTRREVLRRIRVAVEQGIPIVNYGLVLAAAAGVEVEKCVS